ncbi:MAG: benzoate degradation ring-cleavage hydrolase [Myxococcales bacterium]|nr:benzoate degradation ring-cleavage hydrolase [Myxococcales bacterium]
MSDAATMDALSLDALEAVRIDGYPDRPTLVFLHEGLGSVSAWRDFPTLLTSATGCRGFVYSRFGYGSSPPAARPRPLSFMHDEALLLPALLRREGIEDAVLIGHSDGASIALLHAAAHHRGVRGLILEAPHVFVEDICVEAIARIREQYVKDPLLKLKLSRHHRDVDNAFLGWADAWLDPEFRRWSIESCLPDVRASILAIQGTDDEYGTLRQIDHIAAEVDGPSEKLVLHGCGHAPHRDQPGRVLEAMAAFVARVSRPG